MNNNDQDPESILDNIFIPALMELAVAGNFDPETSIDRDKARLLLDVMNNNVDMAVQLYWDDFLMNTMQQQQQQQQDQQDQEEEEPEDDDDEPEPQQEQPANRRFQFRRVGLRRHPELQPQPDNNEHEEPQELHPDDADLNQANAARPVMELLPDDDEDYVRRLDGIFERAHRNELHVRRPPAPRGLHFHMAAARPGQAPGEDYVAVAREFMARARRLLAGRNDLDGDNQDGAEGQVDRNVEQVARRLLAQPRLEPQQGDDPDQAQETVSVSDDEMAGGGIARNMLAQAARARNIHQSQLGSPSSRKRSASDGMSSPNTKRARRARAGLSDGVDGSIAEDNLEVHGYLSDNDWIWRMMGAERSSMPITAPMDLLWGLPMGKVSPVQIEGDDRGNDEPAAEHADNPNVAADRNNESNASNVIADDEEDETSSNNDSGPTDQITGIPRTWLNASFQLDKDAVGLAIFPPRENDIGYYAWQTQQVNSANNSRSSIPPPYHCRALTSIVSVVTALLHTGVSVHNRRISRGWRKPWLELDKDDLKREFHDRLADALTCLLVVAANVSAKRKEVALQKLKDAALGTAKKDDDELDFEDAYTQAEKRKWQLLESKLQLCPTCIWYEEPEPRVLDDQSPSSNKFLATSFTNINDIRSFVMAQMKQFTSSGGVALFLENVLRFHGRDTVSLMLSLARSDDHGTDHSKCLVNCTCEEVHKKKLDESTTAAMVRSNFPNKLDTSPHGHSCLSVELLSLLLTGRVYSSFEGWSTGPLGFGLLTNDVCGQISKSLTRPENPVWILRGPTCYTSLWVNDFHQRSGSFDPRFDQPGSVAMLTHWNPWYSERRKTNFRMVISRDGTAPPADSDVSRAADENDNTAASCKTSHLILKRQKLEKAVSKELIGVEQVDPYMTFAQEALDRIVANPDDQRFYPNKYKSWRFDMGDDSSEKDDESKPRGMVWKPFHRLTDREKVLIEIKLGPKIKQILWTRWPRATIDSFEPADPQPIV